MTVKARQDKIRKANHVLAYLDLSNDEDNDMQSPAPSGSQAQRELDRSLDFAEFEETRDTLIVNRRSKDTEADDAVGIFFWMDLPEIESSDCFPMLDFPVDGVPLQNRIGSDQHRGLLHT